MDLETPLTCAAIQSLSLIGVSMLPLPQTSRHLSGKVKVPRHKTQGPKIPQSQHSWGLESALIPPRS